MRNLSWQQWSLGLLGALVLGWAVMLGGWIVIAALIAFTFVGWAVRNPQHLPFALLVTVVLGQAGRIPPTSTSGGILILDCIAALLFFLWIIQVLRGEFAIPGSVPGTLFAGFLIVALLSFAITPLELSMGTKAVNALYLFRLLFYGALLWMIPVLFVQKAKQWKLLRWVMGTGIAVVILGFLQLMFFANIGFLSRFGWDPHVGRLVSTFLDPNYLGGYFAILLSVLFAYILVKRSNWAWAGVVLVLVATVLTYSRSGYLAVAIAAAAFGLRYSWKALLITAVCVAPLALTIPRVRERVEGGFSVDATSVARIESWKNALVVSNNFPVLGVGYNNYREAQIELGIIPRNSESRAAAGSDSSVLNVLATTGVPGLILFLGFFFVLWRRATDILKLDRTSPRAVASAALLIALPALVIHSLFVNSLFFPFIMAPLFILIGLICMPSEEEA